MATLSRNYYSSGFCPIDKEDVTIEIEYISIPRPTDERGKRTFTKAHNRCCYLREGKCALGDECGIFKNAQGHYVEKVGKV